MANAEARNLVLRTVYLPSELDQELKVVAFREDRSKNEIVRELILEGMAALRAKGDARFVKASRRPSEPVRLQPLKRNRAAKPAKAVPAPTAKTARPATARRGSPKAASAGQAQGAI